MSVNGTGRAAIARANFRWLAFTTVAATYALIVLGGVVRATDSGDACPDWPRCKGELIPPLEYHVLIEFSHRLFATIVGLLVLAVVIFAWRTQRHRTVVVWSATAALVLLIAQVGLGGATVLSELPANLVMAHLAVATVLLAALLVVAIASLDIEPSQQRDLRERATVFRNQALAGALAVFALMLSGSYVSGSGASLAFPDWPLFDGQLMPEGGRLAMIHAAHRFAAVVVGLLLLHVAGRAWRKERWHSGLAFGMVAAVVLYIAQVFAGAANVWTLIQPSAAATHLALAIAVWATLVSVTLFAHRAAVRLPQRGLVYTGELEIAPAQPERATEAASGGGPS